MTASNFSISVKYRILFVFCHGVPWPLYSSALLQTLNFGDLIKFHLGLTISLTYYCLFLPVWATKQGPLSLCAPETFGVNRERLLC